MKPLLSNYEIAIAYLVGILTMLWYLLNQINCLEFASSQFIEYQLGSLWADICTKSQNGKIYVAIVSDICSRLSHKQGGNTYTE